MLVTFEKEVSIDIVPGILVLLTRRIEELDDSLTLIVIVVFVLGSSPIIS